MTGASGFVGRALVAELRSQEKGAYEVHGLERRHGDLAAGESVIAEYIQGFRPDLVVHLAARVGVGLCEEDPAQAIASNVSATAFVARACAAHGARLAYGSTADVYGDHDEPCSEETPVRPQRSLYAMTKWWGEQVARLYAGEGLQVLRIAHPYGPGVEPGRGGGTIPTLLRQAELREPMPVYRGDARFWCWVGDTARGIRSVIERGGEGIYNVGRDDEPVPTLEAARLACDLTGASHELIEEIDPPGGRPSLRVSTEKLRGLGWEPEVDFETGLRLLLDELRSAPEAVSAARADA